MIMGSNTQNPDGETEEPDPEKILKLTRTPKKAPEYKPRSRSLDDLPGGIRVPILLKPQQRLKPKLQESLAGLEELKSLKEKQQQLIDSAKSLTVSRNDKEQTDHSEIDRRPLRSPRRVSCGSLSSISEENAHSFQTNSYINGNLSLSQGRSRRPLSVSDINYIQEEFADTGSLSENRNGSCSSDKSSTSAEFSLSSCASEDGDAVDKENKIVNMIPPTKLHKNLHRSASDNWNLNRQEFVHSFINRNSRPLGRRASVQVDSDIVIRRFEDHKKSNEDIRPKLRRASMQCDAILTKPEATQNMAKMISDIKLNYNFPCPLHAVMRQYGSSSSNLKMSSDKQTQSTDTSKQQVKSAKELVEEWQAVPERNIHNSGFETANEHQEIGEYEQMAEDSESVKSSDSLSHLPRDSDKDALSKFRNVREQSFTSDYFGSVETVNSIISLPTNVYQERGTGGHQHHDDQFLKTHQRRHSLPTTPNTMSHKPRQGDKYLNTEKSDNSQVHKTCYSDSATQISGKSLRDNKIVPKDYKMENDVFKDIEIKMDTSVENVSLLLSAKMNSKLSLASDEGYAPSNPSSPTTDRHRLGAIEHLNPNAQCGQSNASALKNGESQRQTVKKGFLETAL